MHGKKEIIMNKHITRRNGRTGAVRRRPALTLLLLTLAAGLAVPAALAANTNPQGASLPIFVPDYWSATAQTNSTGTALLAAGTTGASPRQSAANGAVLVLNPLALSKEEETIAVPAVTGLTQADAAAALAAAGLVPGTILQSYHPTTASGLIISQDPAAGAEVAPGAAVALTVSMGPEPAEGEPEGEGEVEGEGEPQTEGEGEPQMEGEGEPQTEGEGEPVTPPTTEEARSQIAAMIASVDANGDGLISYSEALAALPELTQDVFNQLDTNGDGSLDKTELGLEDSSESGCNCKKGYMTPDGLKRMFGDLFLAGLSLSALLVVSRIRR